MISVINDSTEKKSVDHFYQLVKVNVVYFTMENLLPALNLNLIEIQFMAKTRKRQGTLDKWKQPQPSQEIVIKIKCKKVI